ncbi:MAG: hypothetical protein HGB36_04345 [Chlorobiaceae bacterium]|nr:hypothetical protein [Chlorobiaceae bacterium]
MDFGDAGSIYTIQFQGENQTEFDKFLENKWVHEEEESLERLLAKLKSMSTIWGFPDGMFKVKEGKFSDYVVALREGKLRLYCLRIEDVLLVTGNGGCKTSRTYQQDPHLHSSVKDLQMVHKVIMSRIATGRTHVDRITGVLRGSLNFYTDK